MHGDERAGPKSSSASNQDRARTRVFCICQDANRINEVASTYAGQAEAFLASKREWPQ
jgi:6-phosphogluconolactonase/glucosamine-6-phosphate isomerase/deaminase